MNRSLIFRRSLDLLGISGPEMDFNGFIHCSENSGLLSSDVMLLRDAVSYDRDGLVSSILESDPSVPDSSLTAISESLGIPTGDLRDLVDDIRSALRMDPGSADAVPSSLSYSGLLFSTAGCMKGEIAVAGCESLDSCIVVPENVPAGSGLLRVTSVGSDAFRGRTGITSVILPRSIREIGYRAFSGCSRLSDFVIPANVTRIGFRAFEGCTSLAYIAVLPQNSHFKTYPGGFLCSMETSRGTSRPMEIIRVPYSYTGSFVVPEGVVTIGSESFEGCSGITDVVIPDCVRTVMYRAFLGCSSLSSVEVPGMAVIGFQAFPDGVSVSPRPQTSA